MYAKRFLLIVAILFLWGGPALSADINVALSAYESGNYRQAYKGFKRLAQDEHVKAQYYLGLLYLSGQGVSKSVVDGLGWLKQAAENGSYLAAAELGQIYVTGKGVEMNEVEAAKWIELSSDLAEAEDADEECD